MIVLALLALVVSNCVVMWKTDRSNINLRSTHPGLDIDILNKEIDTVKRHQRRLMSLYETDTLFIEVDTIK